ncbi:MAG TPA: MtrB/PioB family decaheme-associated outer membrane protein [Gallionella sp.]
MKTNKELFVASKLSLAVQGALVAMFTIPLVAFAAGDDVATLTHPTNTIEIGVENTSKDSAKFGEYNGLNKKGVDLIGNFSVRGGDAYDGKGLNRWEIKGTDLGTTSRELSGSVSNQGQWNLGLGYGELRHNISDTYQTPLQGPMGGNSFTLPANFGVVNTDITSAAMQKAGTQALTATQLSAFHTQEVHTDRKNTSFTAGYNFDRQWGIKFDYNRLDQSGAKLIMVGTDKASAGANGTWGGERNLMLMNPTDYSTDTFSLALNWTGDKGHLTASYFGSKFSDANNGLTFPNPFIGGNTTGSGTSKSYAIAGPATGTILTMPIDTLSTAPSNVLHQLNLTGGYSFSPTMKLAGGMSYSRNTQNESYPYAVMQAGGLPQGSLDALVVTTHADLKLTNQMSKDLTLSAGLKYNERDNRTASSTYNFVDEGQGNATSVNAPVSNKKTQLEVAGDYRIDRNHRLRLAYEYEEVKRWCNNSLANNAQSAAAPAGYYTNSSCVQMPESKDNKLVVGYKLKAGDAVDFKADYSYAKRKADVNSSFYNPMQAISEGFENLGFRAFFDTSRTEQLVKAGVNWQAADKLSLGLNGRYLDDKYNDSPLGVQKGHTSSLNLDATYSYADNGAVSAYLSGQNRQRDMQSGSTRIPLAVSTNIFTNQLKDDGTTAGFSAKQKGLMAGKLDLAGDLTYSLGKTVYSTQVPYDATCGATTKLTCGSTPDIKNETLRFKITGDYHVDKTSTVAVAYLFQKLKSNDYYYNGYQYGYTSTGLMPTNEQAPSYTVNFVGVSYVYSFK